MAALLYRLYYTLLPGMHHGKRVADHRTQAVVAAHSVDGLSWTDRRIVLERRRDVSTEDIGVVGLQRLENQDPVSRASIRPWDEVQDLLAGRGGQSRRPHLGIAASRPATSPWPPAAGRGKAA